MQSIFERTANPEKRWTPEYFIQLFTLIDAERRTLKVIGGGASNPDFRQIMMDKIEVFLVEKRLRPSLQAIRDGDRRPLRHRGGVHHHGPGDAVAQCPGTVHAGRSLHRVPHRDLQRDQALLARALKSPIRLQPRYWNRHGAARGTRTPP